MTANREKTGRRGWRTFSLKAFFILIAIVSVALGWRCRNVRRQDSVLQWIRANGGAASIFKEGNTPPFTRPPEHESIPLWGYGGNIHVELYGDGPGREEAFRGLAEVNRVVKLELYDGAVDDDKMRYVGAMRHLQYLAIHCCKVTDHGLMQLKNCRFLRLVMCSDTDVTDVGAQELRMALPTVKVVVNP
jgi:hypothetical protein